VAPDSARRIVDLSHEIVDGMTTHPGIPAPAISTFLTHEASTARYAPGTTLPAEDWRFFAVPPRIRGMATFPVRAFAVVG
jgi:kynurenine formamidase